MWGNMSRKRCLFESLNNIVITKRLTICLLPSTKTLSDITLIVNKINDRHRHRPSLQKA